MKMMNKIKLLLVILVIVIVVVLVFWLRNATKGDYISFGADKAIEPTPTQVQSIRAIGEWEFLSVSAEELVDTVRKGLLSRDELVRIYYGTLRFGVNMHQVEPGWIVASGDSITVTMPEVGLLDSDFIDEGRTKAFYESGSWKPADRDALYKKAYHQMLSHCMTQENLQVARENARLQMRELMRAMGFSRVEVKFGKVK